MWTAQFIIATHSRILLGYLNVEIFNFDTSPISHSKYEDTEHYIITKQFLGNRERILKELFHDQSQQYQQLQPVSDRS